MSDGDLGKKRPLYPGQDCKVVWPGRTVESEALQQLQRKPESGGNAPVSRRGSQRASRRLPGQSEVEGGLPLQREQQGT